MTQSLEDIRLQDPLSTTTRRERGHLLTVSVLAITIVEADIVPKKIEALGIEFGQADQNSLLIILSVITLYFLAAFLFYAATDFVLWRLAWYSKQAELALNDLDSDRAQEQRERELLIARERQQSDNERLKLREQDLEAMKYELIELERVRRLTGTPMDNAERAEVRSLRDRIRESEDQIFEARRSSYQEESEARRADFRRSTLIQGSWARTAAGPVSAVRALFDFGLPVLVGLFTIYMLLDGAKVF